MTKQSRRIDVRGTLTPPSVIIVGIVVVMAITFAVIVATLDRGFDWSDEGFVYAMIASNRVSTSEFWGFQYLLHPLYDLLGSSVLAFRIVRLVGYVALGVILTLIARALLRSRGIQLGRAGWILVGLVAQIGTFAAWSYPPRYLGYNELSSWFTQLGSALVIFLLLEGRFERGDRRTDRWWVWGITGVVLSLLLVAKISAGAFLTVLAVVAVLLTTTGRAWKRLAGLSAGLLAGLLLMAFSGVPLLSYVVTSIRLGADPSAQAESGYSLPGLLLTYLGSMAVTVSALAIPILLAAVLLLVVRGLSTEGPASRLVVQIENIVLFLAFVLAIVVVSMIVFPGDLDTWASLGVLNAFLLALAVTSFALLVPGTTAAADPSSRRSAVVVGFAFVVFALAPLISALGTNNRIFGHTVFSVTIWAVGAAVGLVLLWRRSTASSAAVRVLPVLLLAVLVGTSGLAVAADVFLHPYRTAPYFTQKSTVEVADLRGLRVTTDQAGLYTWLHDTGHDLDARDVPTLSIATPGALLAFNASAWSAIWPGPAWADSIATSCADGPPVDLYVLQAASEEEGTVLYERLVDGLAGCGIDFPDDFQTVDRYRSDDPMLDVQIWRLR